MVIIDLGQLFKIGTLNQIYTLFRHYLIYFVGYRLQF